MRLIGAHCSIAGGLHKAAERGGALGCTAVQIFTKSSNQWNSPPLLPAEISIFQKSCFEAGIKTIFAHAGYLINLASSDPAVHKLSVSSMRAELERAEMLELPFVIVHPGSHKGAGELVGILQVVSAIKELVEATSGFKTHIVLETTAGQGRSIGHKFEHFAEIFKRLPKQALKRVGICVDTAHVFAAGYDITSRAKYNLMWKEFDGFVGFEFLRAVHLNDSAKTLGSRVDRHEHIGKGEIGLEPFRWLLNDKRFINIPMIIETPKGETPA
ncbi:MAG: deoxyribonuclease IV, partial [Deltaproteobacteria bacterium]|nr:deoxyribonuclease IV [Deltaproteobacteria bacterium]